MIILLSKIIDILTPENRRGVYFLMVAMLFIMILEMLSVSLIIPVIVVLTQHDIVSTYPIFQTFINAIGNPSQKELIIDVMLLLLIGYFLKNIFLAFFAWKKTRFIYDLQAEFSQRLFTIYLGQPYTFHLQRNSATLVRNVRAEVSMVTNSIIMPIINIFAEVLVLIGISVLLIIIEPIGILIVITILSITAWGFYSLTKGYILRWGKARQYHDGLSLQHLNQGLGGVKDVKLLGRGLGFLNEFAIHTSQSAKMNQLQATLKQMPRLWLELLGVIGLVALVLIMISQGREISTIIPLLGLFAAAAFRLMPSVNRILSGVQQLRYGLPAIDVLHKELSLLVEESKTNEILSLHNKIELSNISYTYPGSSVVSLNKIFFSVEKGKTVGVIGSSGSGKSTLVDIILGLLSPTDGQVKIDNYDIQLNLRSWQDQIGYVPQSIYLTDDTLRRNVAFGLSENEIDDIAVHRAIKAAQLEDFVISLSDGLETMVGEHGVRLSGGQRQRIGIARALYHDPAVLVLDEATSALDEATEKNVMTAITALQGSKTIIIVAHRLSTVKDCDRIYRLANGSIVEEGNAKDILNDI